MGGEGMRMKLRCRGLLPRLTVLLVGVLLASCAGRAPRCDGTLEPINAPAPSGDNRRTDRGHGE